MLKQALDFALLEDFDHLYRYANLYELIDEKDASALTDSLTEITPGRPTIVEHRHPLDEVRGHYSTHTVDPLSRMHVMTIVAGAQQTMNFYMNHGTDRSEEHKSELQSLMSISYAVFCLKKTKIQQPHTDTM